MGEFSIYVRDKDLKIASEIKTFDSLDLNIRHNEIGSWKMVIPFDADVVSEILDSFYAQSAGLDVNKGKTGIVVIFSETISPDDSTIAQRVIFSGPIRFLARTFDENGDFLTIGGPDDLGWIEQRFVIPGASTNQNYANSYSPSFNVVFSPTPLALNIMISRDLGGGAHANRRYSFIAVSSIPSAGYPTIWATARFTNLWDECKRVLSFSENQGFPLKIYARQSTTLQQINIFINDLVDRSIPIKFGPDLGNVLSFEYIEEASRATRMQVGDNQTGTARTFSNVALGTGFEDRHGDYEQFRSSNTASTIADLDDEAEKYRKQEESTISFRFKPNPLSGFEPIKNYFVGDIISLVIFGQTTSQLVREFQIRISSDEVDIETVVGSVPAVTESVYSKKIKKTNFQLNSNINF